MGFALNTLLFGLLAGARAAIVQLPIYAKHDHNAYDLTVEQTAFSRPVKSYSNLFYKTNISIGTPPQTFEVALDTFMGETFVPSADCSEPCPSSPNHTYNNSQSSTYLEHGGYADSKWAGVDFRGPLSYDVVRLGESKVDNFLFEEWTSASCVSIGCFSFGYDGVLGLSPPWNQRGPTRPNILSTLLSQKALDEPIFSLELPIGLHDAGSIVFGAQDPKINRSTVIELPTVNVTDSPFSASWSVPASKISFDSPHPLETTLATDSYAVLDSSLPYLILPSTLADNLTAAVGATPGPAWFYHIPCERRQELPSLTFTLDGKNFSISAFDYILEVDPPRLGRTCITTFMAAREFGIPPDWKFILLGSPFLRGFHSIWNFESRKVSLASMQRP